MAHSIAPAIKNSFEIFITLTPPVRPHRFVFGGQSPQNPKGRLDSAFLCGHYSGISGLASTKQMPDLNHPLFSASSFCIFRQISAPQRAILLPSRGKVPLCGGGRALRDGVVIVSPVIVNDDTPRPEPPTQTMFARGPVGVGHSSMSLLVHSLPLSFPRRRE